MCCVFMALDFLIECYIYFVLQEGWKKINKEKLLKIIIATLSWKKTKTKGVAF